MKISLATRHLNPKFTPLSLLYLKAYVVAHGGVDAADVTIREFGGTATGEAIATTVLNDEPDILGMSCYLWNITAQLDAARRIKAARPSVKIVLGGPEVGPVAEAVLEKNSCVDVVVRSEGEFPFCDLVKCWRDGGSVAGVPGVTYRDGDRVVATEDAEIVTDLNCLESPHIAGYIDHTNRIICIETQRGCVFRCSFCFYNKDLSIRNRRFELGRVKEEIRFWLDQDIREIFLMDPVFNLNAARAKEICRFIAEHNHRQVPFHTEVWAEFIDDEMAGLFVAANICVIEVGLQTTDTATLEAVDRRLKLKPFLDGIRHLKEHNLNFQLQLIGGLPGETTATLRKSLNYAASLDPPDLAMFQLMILPGTELWRKAKTLGIEYDPEPPYHVISTNSMSADEIQHVRVEATVVDTLWKSQTLRLLSGAPNQSFADVVDGWIAWRGGVKSTEELAALLPDFVSHYVEKHGIEPAFFETFAREESKRKGAVLAAL